VTFNRNDSLLDIYLDAVTVLFNTYGENSIDFGWLSKELRNVVIEFNNNTKHLRNNVELKGNLQEAKNQLNRLNRTKSKAKVLDEKILTDRFEDITDKLDLSTTSINKAIRATKELVYDLDSAREWYKELQKVLKKMQQLELGSMEALIEIGKAILGRAVELCPIDTGFLRSSGSLLIYDDYIVIVFSAPYATYVHENMSNYHPIGRAKFLEIALQEFMPDKMVWVELEGTGMVYAKIGLDKSVLYKH
jgi:chromosome segregation ATPase